MRTTVRHGLLIAFVMALMLSAIGSVAAAPAADGPNLLQNPGFESPFVKQCCHTESGYPPNTPIDEVQVAWGWSGWWLQPGLDPQHPSSGGNPSWHRPEWREANCGSACANRVRSGGDAQKYFTFWSVHDAGMYQQVSGVTPGALLRFSVYMQAWSVNAAYGPSSHDQTMGMRVGIDPFGGTDAFSSDVIWSDSFDTYDAWGLYSIEATARGGTVTVFTRSTPYWGNEHNDIYLDDASLAVVNASNQQPTAPPPTTQPTVPPPAPQPTLEPAPVSGFTYVVQPGDNFYFLAQRFGVSLSLLYQVNHITNPNILYVGTVLIIPSANPPPAPQPTVEPAPVSGLTYVVQPGDNFYLLAQRFGVSLSLLYQVNHITNPNILYVGTVLIIPSANPPVGATGEPTNPPPAPTTPPAQLPGAFAYTVQSGDNLYRISVRFGVSIARIKELNGLVGDIIFIGQTLIIAP